MKLDLPGGMPVKRGFKKARPKCWVCGGILKIKGVIPAAHTYPELRTYQCNDCGAMRTIESEQELAEPQSG
jgi:hypothetical protein